VWLSSQVGSVDVKNLSKRYWKLLRFLYQKEFTWSDIEMDDNRAEDGKDLRRDFLRETGTTMDEPGWLELPCSMLELLIALSCKLEFQSEIETCEWFWILIENIGLLECTDANPPDEQIVDHILDRVILRDYAVNGAGGLFPLEDSHEDQRQVELWYQAEAYLLERL
jgi:hypothetical protein